MATKKQTHARTQSDFYRTLLHYPDEKQAAEKATEQAGLGFDATHPEHEQLKRELPDLDARYKASKAKLAKLDEAVDSTPQYIKTCAEYTGKESAQVRFSGWQSPDKVSFIFLNVALIIALFMSWANVDANLLSSGVPIFIEQPWIAWFLSLLAPAASIALKFTSGFFDYYRTKRRYTLFIFLLTALSFLAWVILFSMNYSGVSSGIDWNSFGEGSTSGSLLVGVQLFTEILVAAALFLAAQDIAIKYSPDLFTESLAHTNAVNARDRHLKTHIPLRDERNTKHARFTQLNAERKASINEQVVAYTAARARFNAMNSL